MEEKHFFKGKLFGSFSELSDTKQKYEQSEKINISIRRSVTIETDYKSGNRKIEVKKDLKYTGLSYICMNSGYYLSSREKRKLKELESSNDKKNRKTSTYSTGCEFFIKLNVTKDGQYLEVKDMQDKHNHDTDQIIFENLPNQRKLSAEAAKETEVLMGCYANTKKNQNLLHKQGIMIHVKDIHNHMRNKLHNSNIYEDVTNLLESYDNLHFEIFAVENICKGLFLQTDSMKKNFAAFPEVIFLDATYRLNQLHMKLYVMMIMDGNGESEVVMLAFVQSEDRESLSWVAEQFIKNNPNYVKVNCIMSDKDMTEREVMKLYFPNAKLCICSFHVLRNFNREVTVNKRNITKKEAEFSLELIQGLVYAKDEGTYNIRLNLLKENCPKEVVQYVMKNWDPIKSEWVRGLQKEYLNFFQLTNNRVESFNRQVKDIVKLYSAMTRCIIDLMQLVSHYDFSRNQRALKSVIKQPLQVTQNTHLLQYSKFLTPYACLKLEVQLEVIEKVEIMEVLQNNIVVKCYSYENLIVSPTECTCRFRVGMGLPCRHIFKVREYFKQPLFSEGLCIERWHASYYAKNQRLLSQIKFNTYLKHPDTSECSTQNLDNCIDQNFENCIDQNVDNPDTSECSNQNVDNCIDQNFENCSNQNLDNPDTSECSNQNVDNCIDQNFENCIDQNVDNCNDQNLDGMSGNEDHVTHLPKKSLKNLSKDGKFKLARLQTDELCDKLSLLSVDEYEEKYERLIKICSEIIWDDKFWKSKSNENVNPTSKVINKLKKVPVGSVKGRNGLKFSNAIRIRARRGKKNVIGLSPVPP